MFVNISNHPSSKWSTAQRSAAEQLGGAIIDIPFPNIPATATRQEIAKLAKAMFADLVERYPTPGYAMVAGGGTLCSLLILALSILGWEVVFEQDRSVRFCSIPIKLSISQIYFLPRRHNGTLGARLEVGTMRMDRLAAIHCGVADAVDTVTDKAMTAAEAYAKLADFISITLALAGLDDTVTAEDMQRARDIWPLENERMDEALQAELEDYYKVKQEQALTRLKHKLREERARPFGSILFNSDKIINFPDILFAS